MFRDNSLQNPVGVGRYDNTKHEKYPKKIRYRSLYMNEAQRYLSNLERDKCLQERITPVNKGQHTSESLLLPETNDS
ncbi:UNVERIFIED_CONTAM: hypothetical protein K2H54_054166 [Gekko kuhli]